MSVPSPPVTAAWERKPTPHRWDQVKRFGRGAFIAVIAFNVGSSLYRSWKTWKELVTLPSAFYLELDLEQNTLIERTSSNPLSLLRAAAGKEIELHKLIKLLHAAKADDRVRGLFTLLGDRGSFGGMAQLQELRNALLDFRFHTHGRAPVYAYSNAFCEGGSNGTGVYFLASAADKVFMAPTGMLSLLGFASSQVFVKGLLDRFKVQPEVFRREEYKSALAPLTGTGYDPAHRENLTALLRSLYDQVIQGISSARRLTPAAVESAINASPLLASQAMQLKLLDGLAYRDQVEALLLQQLPAEAQKAHAEPLTAPRGVPIAVAHRSKQLAGPRVSLQRYSLAQQWAQTMREFWSGGQPGNSSSSSSTAATSAGNSSSSPQLQQLQDGGQSASTTGSQPLGTDHAAVAGSAAGAQQGQAGGKQLGLNAAFVLPMDKPIVAVVTAAGPIMQASTGGPEAGQSVVESNKLVRVLRGYRENPQVKAVVLRINSPGGSAVASDMIAREVQLLRDCGKPVVACMGDVAASGGYYIAASCNKILAQPGTITGSIGVIFMKLNVKDALQEYGVTGDDVSFGDNADWASGLHPLTPKQQQQIDGMISATYDDFLAVVARGRGLTKEGVRAVAKGRVWSGSQAMEVGLVDEVGGLVRATDLVKQLAGLPLEPEATITQEWPPSRVPPVVKALQAAGGLDGSPLEASSTPHRSWWTDSMATPAVLQHFLYRAAAAAELASIFWNGAILPSWGSLLPQHLLQPLAAALGQQSAHRHPVFAAAAAGGVEQQLVSVLTHLARAHNQPEMYCMDAEALARCC